MIALAIYGEFNNNRSSGLHVACFGKRVINAQAILKA